MTLIAPRAPTSPARPPGSARSSVWAIYAAVSIVTLAVYAYVLQLWNADPAVSPYYAYGGDVFANFSYAKDFFDQHNLYRSPLLAAPLSGAIYEFPLFCGAQLPVQLLLNVVTGSWTMALNLVSLLALPAAAASTLFALRRLDIRTWIAFPLAVLFALMPRFAGGMGRLDLPVFWIIPLSGLICVLVARGDTVLFARRNGRPQLTRDGWCVLIAAILTGAGNQYYAFFTVALLGAATLIATLKTRSIRPIFVSVGISAIVCAGILVQFTPTLAYEYAHGRNTKAFARYPQEAQTYALEIAQLVLPVGGHRGNGWLAAQREFYESHAPWGHSEATASSLGAIASVGFLALLAALAVRAASTLPYDLESLALLNIAALLLAVPSGFGALFNYYVSPDIRAYNRISLFIAFFALAGLAQILMYCGRRWRWRIPVPARVGLVAVTIAFGTWDQTTPAWIPPYAASEAEYRSDAQFVSAIESRIGSGAAFELPWMRFPESPPIGKLAQGDLFRPFVHARTLRTTFGAIEGRDPYEWQQAASILPVPDMIRAVVLGGFDGFIVFRDGYLDGGAALEGQLGPVLGKPVVSPDGRLAFYSAHDLRRRMIAVDPEIGTAWYAERMVRTIFPVFGKTFVGDPPAADSLPVWRSNAAQSSLLLRNDSRRTRPVELHALVDFGGNSGTLDVQAPARAVAVAVAARPAALTLRFDVAPGKTFVHFQARGSTGADRPAFFRLTGPSVTPLDIDPPTAQASAAMNRALSPIITADTFAAGRVRVMSGCWPLETLKGHHWNWCDSAGTLLIESDRSAHLRLSGIALTPGTPTSVLRLDVDGTLRQIKVEPSGTHFEVPIDVTPLRPVIVNFSSNAQKVASTDTRRLVVQLFDPQLR